MSRWLILVLLLFQSLLGISQETSKSILPVRNLISRLLPTVLDSIALEIIPSQEGKDVFEIDDADKQVIIRGNNAVSLASGLNWYLKYYCQCHVSGCGSNLRLPMPLPRPTEKVRKVSIFPLAYYLNYCTFNYTMSFWNWENWEQEIDRMALNGINLPLAITGMETVWQNTLRRFGYSQAEIDAFISGPAYLAWWWMGNLEGVGGPLPQSWYQNRTELQKKILERMREFGMEPVFPAFYGMVPNSLKQKFPLANITEQGEWAGGLKRSAFLMPGDSLFKAMAAVFYSEQKTLFGECRYFSGDPLHEGGNSNDMDLQQAGIHILQSMRGYNTGATWMLQGWGGNPKESLISGLPKDGALILDLWANHRPQWKIRHGWSEFPWVWSIIDNFGGKQGIFGALQQIAQGPFEAMKDKEGGTITGIGAMMEGIENNPVTYDLLFEMRWNEKPVDVDKWVQNYATRRYGRLSADAANAWRLLAGSAYQNGFTEWAGPPESIFCARPDLEIKKTSNWGTNQIPYDEHLFLNAWFSLSLASMKLHESPAYQFDLVDITRQTMDNLGLRVYQKAMEAYKSGKKEDFSRWAKTFLEMIDDQDQLVGTIKAFQLGEWLRKARDAGSTEAEKELYELNARSLITTWTFSNSNLGDYAHREYSGLLKDYYKVRWGFFFNELDKRFKGRPPESIDFYPFEKKWTQSRSIYSSEAVGKAVYEAKRIQLKYLPLIKELYQL